jgi:hypothetical protein
MRALGYGAMAITLLVSAFAGACASSGAGEGASDRNPNLLTREEILSADATNLYDVIYRLRPRWLQVRSQRSFSMPTEVAVLQNDSYMGDMEVLRQMTPELAIRIEYLEGSRAATSLPGLMSGRHIEGAIIVRTRSP